MTFGSTHFKGTSSAPLPGAAASFMLITDRLGKASKSGAVLSANIEIALGNFPRAAKPSDRKMEGLRIFKIKEF